MDNVITDFRTAKQQYEGLKGKAKKVYQAEFSEALTEAARLFTEFKAEFGEALDLPSAVTKFTVNAEVKTRKPRTPKNTPAAETTTAGAGTTGTTADQPETSTAIGGRKLAGLKKSFKSLTTKIATAKAEGKPTKNLEDELYQVTDELRLAGVNVDALAAEATPAEPPVTPAPEPAIPGTFNPF